MYENGKRVNGYRRKRMHKRKMKQSYAKTWVYGDGMSAWNTLVLEYKDTPAARWGHPLNYWKDCSHTTARQFAKHQTDHTLRREFNNVRNKVILADPEDFMEEVPTLSRGEYRRYFDYGWTVW